ncbi:terminase large subunit [Roseinatronobacter bogoriensis]|uniref:terminase large subunit n=1 Tax=Roseinatronobacter bogoriensis TaxID=119542 RepID=UPI001066B63D|nr:terminase TerL endonuclease subunit [Rhodobaca bogoriensis]MBB4207273.1 phage terminase large subunit-like protein [Rhodobaca bogoriensis DSM 18756]TDY65772.1 phage terminase large subunit-like protein [Rhodobaca bogoriensis DSM 18756]
MNMPLRREVWDTSLPDWEDRITKGASLVPDLPLNDAMAEKAVRIFKRLRCPDLIGMPSYGEICDDWVFDLVRAIFGSYDPETKRRALREFFLLIPKKNGKSSVAAAIIVTAAILNERPEAELLLIAPTMTIAKIAFKQAWGIIRADAELEALFHVREHLRTIRHRVTGAEISVKAAQGDVITGGKATYTLIDETHEFAKSSKAEGVFLELRGALASRPDGFLMQITTQSKESPAGVFRQELEKARSVRDGRMKLPILAVLYELPKVLQKSWQDPATWPLVNPNLGRSVDEGFLADQLTVARENGPHALALLASQHFNVEIGVGQGGAWVGAQFWAQAAREGVTLEQIIGECEVAVAGVDGGGLDDLLGLGVIGRHRETKRWMGWAHAWAHPEVLRTRKEIAPRLRDFEQAGDLTILAEDDPTGDIIGVADVIERLKDAALLPDAGAVGLDPYGVSAIIDELAGRGISDEQLAAIGQGARLSPEIWGIERKLKDGTFVHGGQPMMDWVLGNARIEQRGSAVLITKEAAGRAKIDPLMALLNAFKLMSRNPVCQQPVDYDAYLKASVVVA